MKMNDELKMEKKLFLFMHGCLNFDSNSYVLWCSFKAAIQCFK